MGSSFTVLTIKRESEKIINGPEKPRKLTGAAELTTTGRFEIAGIDTLQEKGSRKIFDQVQSLNF